METVPRGNKEAILTFSPDSAMLYYGLWTMAQAEVCDESRKSTYVIKGKDLTTKNVPRISDFKNTFIPKNNLRKGNVLSGYFTSVR